MFLCTRQYTILAKYTYPKTRSFCYVAQHINTARVQSVVKREHPLLYRLPKTTRIALPVSAIRGRLEAVCEALVRRYWTLSDVTDSIHPRRVDHVHTMPMQRDAFRK